MSKRFVFSYIAWEQHGRKTEHIMTYTGWHRLHESPPRIRGSLRKPDAVGLVIGPGTLGSVPIGVESPQTTVARSLRCSRTESNHERNGPGFVIVFNAKDVLAQVAEG